MNSIQSEDLPDSPLDTLKVFLVATFAGALVGIVGGTFRAALNFSTIHLLSFIAYLHTIDTGWFISGFIVAGLITSMICSIIPVLLKQERIHDALMDRME